MYYICLIHYVLVKGIYVKRHKNLSASASALSFMCLCFLIIFLFIFFIDKSVLWDLVRRRLPYGSITKGLLFVLLPFLLYFSSTKSIKDKIRKKRRVLFFKKKIVRIYSLLYVFVFVFLFFLSIIIAIKARTPYI